MSPYCLTTATHSSHLMGHTLLLVPPISYTGARRGVRVVVLKIDLKCTKCALDSRLIKSTPDEYGE